MRRTELRTCKRCKKIYTWDCGGIVMTPNDHADKGLCEACRGKGIHLLHILMGNNGK